jgi:hypothetical protein
MPTYYRAQGTVNTAQGPAVSGCEVYICTQPATTTTIPPSPLASLYTDSTGATPLAQPVLTDGLGNWFAYTATGTYTIVFYDPNGRIPTTIFPDQPVVTQGGGSVTSVGLTMPVEFSVAGTPISSSGTLAVTKANQNANLVYAGPSSGGAAAPTFRALVSGDLPSGGTVTSVAVSVTGSSTLLSITVTGSPITGSGTITIPIQFANFSANTVIAGPASGAASAPTARALVAADIAGTTAVSFSASPTFNAANFAMPTFTMLLTGNVTSSTISNPTAGQIITFVITQNGTGGWTFTWPTNTHGSVNVDSNANAVTVLSFVYDGSFWRTTGPGSTNQT